MLRVGVALRPQPFRGHDHEVGLAGSDPVLQGVQLPLRPSFRPLHRPFANKWLNISILWELLLLAAVVHVPFLHAPFGTFNWTLERLAIVMLLAFTVSSVLELAKWLERRGWFGRMA